MSAPKRIQLSRKEGFRLPPDAINVARPTRWGNPFKVGIEGVTPERAVELYCGYLWSAAGASNLRLALDCLRGHDLACWCKPGAPCHADVLLKVVNDPRAKPLKNIFKGQEVVIMGERCTINGPDTLGWGSFEFTGGNCQGIYHSAMGPVYSPAVLDLLAGKEAA